MVRDGGDAVNSGTAHGWRGAPEESGPALRFRGIMLDSPAPSCSFSRIAAPGVMVGAAGIEPATPAV